MKWDENKIYEDFPKHSQEFSDFLDKGTDIPPSELEAHIKEFDRLAAEYQAQIDAWKASHKDYFDDMEAIKKRRIEKCESCAHCTVKEDCMLLFVMVTHKCAIGQNVRENGYCKGWKARMKVEKVSGKPFKSTFKVNTVKDIVVNPNTGKPAYTFMEDDSCVDCWQCREVKGK